MTWNWKPIGVPTTLEVVPPALEFPTGTARIAVSSDELVHLLTEGPEQVRHFTIDRDGVVVRLPDLPLRTLSSAVADSSGMAVAGASNGDNRPIVCRVDGSGDATPIDVPSTFESGEAAPVAAWPKLASVGELWVIWAVGREVAEVRYGKVTDGDVHTVGNPLPATFVLDLQAAAGAAGVDVLWQDADGVHVRHDVNRSGESIAAQGFSSKTRLVNGSLLTPRAEHSTDIFQIRSRARHQLPMPTTPNGEGAEIVWVETMVEPTANREYLAWTTQSGAEDLGDPPGLSAPSRSWIAPIDGNWRLGPPSEVPAFSQCFAALGDRVFAFPVAGPVLGWWSAPT